MIISNEFYVYEQHIDSYITPLSTKPSRKQNQRNKKSKRIQNSRQNAINGLIKVAIAGISNMLLYSAVRKAYTVFVIIHLKLDQFLFSVKRMREIR